MFKPIFLSFGVVAPVVGLVGGVAPARGDGGIVAVQAAASDASGRRVSVQVSTADDEEHPGVAKVPPVWIGLRLSRLPEALQAHLQRDGLMVTNVVVDGPADRAGVQRYDVIVAFDGREVSQMRDLADAIAEAGAGNEVEMTLIRNGVEQTVRIVPASRDEAGELTFKYDEPKDPDAEMRERYFGHRIMRDPTGFWVFSPLGRMDLPDAIRRELDEIDAPAWRDWLEDAKQFRTDPFSLHVEIDEDDPLNGMIFFGGGDFDEHATIDIRIDGDDGSLHVRRNPDGSFDVTRTDPDGVESSASYADIKELCDADPQAGRVFRRHTGARLFDLVPAAPDWHSLPDEQKEFQKQVREKLEQTRERLRKAKERAKQLRSRASASASASSDGRSISISYSSDDGWRIDIDDEDGHRHYEFDDLDAFKRANPRDYERYREQIESAGGQSRRISRLTPHA
ncbi:MAG: PDZ domain-containing protein [Planctomycetota bacterium]|nr:MAG: PDZ domain-containing protein [Planctomycetota bacterium]